MQQIACCMVFHVRWISHHFSPQATRVGFRDSWWDKSISHGKPYKMHIFHHKQCASRCGPGLTLFFLLYGSNPIPNHLYSYVCWSLTSLCHSNGHIETMPAREINPFTALTRIRSQFSQHTMTNNHQRVDKTTPQTAQPSGLAFLLLGNVLWLSYRPCAQIWRLCVAYFEGFVHPLKYDWM